MRSQKPGPHGAATKEPETACCTPSLARTMCLWCCSARAKSSKRSAVAMAGPSMLEMKAPFSSQTMADPYATAACTLRNS